MLNLPLDPTDDRAKPAFQDVASCTRWLKQLQFTNLHVVHGVVRAQLDEFNRYPMQGLERLRTLELLRETVTHLQTDYAKKIAARKLPLSEEEFTILASITALWQQMVNGYHRCLQSLLAGDKQLAPYGSLLCQRCLLHTSLQIFECLHNGYEFEGRLWQQLHTLYAFCEEKNWPLEKLTQLADGHLGNAASCHVTYVKTLLGACVFPGELSRAQLQLTDRLLLLWSATITLDRHFTTSKGDAPPLAVDLAGSHGLEQTSKLAANQIDSIQSTVRYLPMLPLSKLLRVKIILLQQGQSPQQLDLGDDCNSTDCIALLKLLHRRWCAGSPDGTPRQHGAAKQAQMCYGQMCYGIEMIYTRIAKKPSRSLDTDAGSDSLARKQIATFGRVLSRDDRHDGKNTNPLLETWQIVEENMLGAVMLREGITDLRLSLKQIVAVQTVHAGAFILGAISWLQVTQSGHLSAGVNYLPGIPQAVRISGMAAKSAQSVGALLLPAVATLKIPSSLIIPRDWFAPERVIELANRNHKQLKIKMGLSIEIGQDYERISFIPV